MFPLSSNSASDSEQKTWQPSVILNESEASISTSIILILTRSEEPSDSASVASINKTLQYISHNIFLLFLTILLPAEGWLRMIFAVDTLVTRQLLTLPVPAKITCTTVANLTNPY